MVSEHKTSMSVLNGGPLVLRPGERQGNVKVYPADGQGSYIQSTNGKSTFQLRLSRENSIEMALALLKHAGMTIERTAEMMNG